MSSTTEMGKVINFGGVRPKQGEILGHLKSRENSCSECIAHI